MERVVVPERPTAVIRATTTWPEYPALWRTLLDEVYTVVRGRINVMLYLDDVPHVEVGVLRPAGFVPRGRVVGSALPGGLVARTVHRGPYERLGEAHRAVLEAYGGWTTGVRWEVYGHPREDPAELETEVVWQLRP